MKVNDHEINWLKEARGKKLNTFLLLIPQQKHNQQEQIAYSLHSAVKIIDWKTEFLKRNAAAQNYLKVRLQDEIDYLKQLSNTNKNKILCVINTEYQLTRMNIKERDMFWHSLWGDFPYNDCIIVYTVLNVSEILPSSVELEKWMRHGRVLNE